MRKKNEEIKGRIGSCSLIPVYTIHLSTVHMYTRFQSSRPPVPQKSVTKNFNLKGNGMTESQNDKSDRMKEGQGKSSIAPIFFKAGL